eukprot:TRINITY_DN762_c0_g3_i1.p1 TRINITY_DN762_c0_g3~~TRINITY_DN762_c0_g3_i1.p1  ORF type:complete len:726 (-),score=198.76 TRINITY_DN762_c0_g3_i1:281-2458(-)
MEAEGHAATAMQDDAGSGSEGSTMEWEPLTAQGKQDVINVVEAYGHFWSNIKFTKGWATPPFKREEVEDLLHQAAEYVVRIRNHLDAKDASMKMRVRDGSAQEYFWGIDWDPAEDPRRFVVELVHATLKDARGYVEGLSEPLVNEYIAEIDDYYATLPHHHRRHPGRRGREEEEGAREASAATATMTTPATDWAGVVDTMLQKAAASLQQIRAVGRTASKRSWVSVCGELERVNRRLERILEALTESDAVDVPMTPMTPATPVTPASGNAWGKRRRLLRQSQAQQRKAEATAAQKPATATNEETKEAPHEALPSSPTSASTLHTEPAAEAPAAEADSMATDEEPHQPTDIAAEQEGEEAGQEEAAAEAAAATEEENEKASSAAEDAQSEAASSDSEAKIKIGRIGEHVSSAKKDVQVLLEECRELDAQRLTSNGDGGSYLEKLRKRCLWLSHELMENMLSLDQITTADPQERSKKKEQIVAIQDILSTVDDLSEKLEAYEDTLRKAREAKAQQQQQQQREAEEREQQERQERQAREAALRARLAQILKTVLDEAKWKTLRLDPKFEAVERADAYVVKAYVPGMLKRNISVDLADGEQGANQLVVRGSRLPSQQDVRAMVQQLQTALQRGQLDVAKLQGLSDEQLLMLLAQGRFGTFVKHYTLPEDVDAARISADYENGVLFVLLPKEVAHPFAPYFAPTSRRLSPPPRGYAQAPPQYSNLADLFW